ncbi:MAG: M20 family metallopeptidase [Opitutaceae bacterium]|nr:M20 family metallopeptidase [Opitutaceae bacterium]
MTPAAYLDQHQADLAGFLQRLIHINTTNPPGENYGEITALLTATLRDLGLQARRLPIPSALQKKLLPGHAGCPRYNVLGFLDAGARKTIHFNAHYDVVPVSGLWRHGHAFNPVIQNGWIYGRGAADMKGAIASIIFALRALLVTGTSPRCNLEVSFTADEETDSALGAEWLVSNARLRADYAVVGEGGSGNTICCGHNGVLWFNIHVQGRAAHGAEPAKGVNALEKMAAIIVALEGYKKRISRRSLRTPDGKIMHPTINVGGVFAPGPGGKVNTVPAHGSFTIDRRVLTTEDHRTAERELRSFLRRTARQGPPGRVIIEKSLENFSCYLAPKHPFFTAMSHSVARVRRRPSSFMISTGFNDMHFFAKHLGIPTLGYGPGGRNYHAVDERARIKDLVNSAKIYTELVTTFAG